MGDLAPSWRCLASRPDAAAVSNGEGAALRPTEEALGSAEVEDLAVTAEHDRDDVGIRSQPPSGRGADRLVVSVGFMR